MMAPRQIVVCISRRGIVLPDRQMLDKNPLKWYSFDVAFFLSPYLDTEYSEKADRIWSWEAVVVAVL